MKIILTRHGETEENKEGVLQGWKPGHLSLEGKNQAKLLAGRLKDLKIDIIYTSDLKRCVDTAKEIANYHKESKLIKEKLLRERGLGNFEGKKIGKSDWDVLPGDIYTNKPLGGESFEDVWERLKKFYNLLIKKYKNETILVVGHGGSQCMLQGILQKTTFLEAFEIKKLGNTATSEFEIDSQGNCKVLLLNSEEHLK